MKIFFPKKFSLKIFLAKKIFFFGKGSSLSLPPPTIQPLHTTPTPSYLLIEVEGGGRNERTYGPDGRNDCSFYCIRWAELALLAELALYWLSWLSLILISAMSYVALCTNIAKYIELAVKCWSQSKQ